MMNFCRHALAAFALAFVAGIVQPASAQVPSRYAQLIGSWACAAQTPSGSMTVTTTYRPDGTFISLGTNHDTSGGRDLYFVITGGGTWSINGDQLIETGSGFDMIWGRLNGQPIIPDTDLWNNMSNAMRGVIGQQNIRRIDALSATSITLSIGGSAITCPRP